MSDGTMLASLNVASLPSLESAMLSFSRPDGSARSFWAASSSVMQLPPPSQTLLESSQTPLIRAHLCTHSTQLLRGGELLCMGQDAEEGGYGCGIGGGGGYRGTA